MKQFKRKLAALLAVLLVLGGIIPTNGFAMMANAAETVSSGDADAGNVGDAANLETKEVALESGLVKGQNYGLEGTLGIYVLDDMPYDSSKKPALADGTTYEGYVRADENPNPKNGDVPETGAVVKFVAERDCKISFAINQSAGKKYYFVTQKADGTSSYETLDETGCDEKLYMTMNYDLEAGNTYYVYRSGSKASFTAISYSYERPVVIETARVAIESGLVKDKNYGVEGNVGIYVLDDMPYDSSKKPTLADGTAYEGYVRADENPNPKNGAVPTTGAVLKFVAEKDTDITFAINQSATKKYYFVTEKADGTSSYETLDETGCDEKLYMTMSYKLEAGNTYYAYRSGSKASFTEITYTYEKVDNGDEEEKLPEIDLVDGVLAFPTAEGGGRLATGGRGGDVYVVTSLEDYGKGETAIEGTLRHAMETTPAEGRIVVFNVGGTIMLEQEMKIANNVTLMGQTAPGEGITLAGMSTGISDKKNMIIRFMHFRPGAVNVHNGSDGMDALWGRDMDTFIIDHCSFSWNTDECLSTYRGQNGTVQWSIISESLTLSGHSKGRHGYGAIFGGDNCTFQYNLIANHTSRNPRIGGGYMGTPTVDNICTLQMTNNVLYNWGFNNCYGGGYAYTNYINNYHRPGIGTNDSVRDQLINPGSSGEPSGFYIAGNYVEGTDNPFIKDAGYDKPETAYEKESFDDVTIIDAKDCYELVLNAAGSTYPKRDAIDARVIQSVIDDTGFFVNTEDEVGGYCAPTETRAADYDTDMDGIPDEWETAHSLDPKNNLDSRELAPSGYAWVEEYCNELVGEQSKATYVAPNPVVTMDLKNNTLVDEGKDVVVNVEATAKNGGKIAKVEFYNGVELVGTDAEAPFSYTYKGLTDDTYNISVRAYDNDGNATQSAPAKLHVNSTNSAGDWTLATVGKADVEGKASLTDGVLTVKGNGKLGIRDGADAEFDKANGTDYTSATTDEFAFAYQKMTGDVEIVTRLDSYIATNIHTFNGIMFRESLDDNAATVGLGFGMSKQVESTTIWNAFMAQRATTNGSISNLNSNLDSPSSAEKGGIPFVYALNFKNGAEFLGMWLKMAREGDNFTGYVSEDGLVWKKVGTLTVDLPEEVYVGFAVESGEGANNIDNYATAKFSNIKINTEFASISYDIDKLNYDGAEKVAVGEDVAITLSVGAGYLLPETVEVTKNGIPADFTYDAKTGVIFIEKAEGEYQVKAVGVKRQVVKVDYEIVDPDNKATWEEKDGVITIKQTSVNGALANNPDTPAKEQTYLLFPETTHFQTMSMKVKITDMVQTANPKQTGLFVGAFNIPNNTFTSMGWRHSDGNDEKREEFAPFWTKDATRTGNGGPRDAWDLNVEYEITFKSNGKGGLYAKVVAAEGSDAMKAGNTKEWGAQGAMYMMEGDTVRFGLGVIGMTVEVSDLVLIDHEGNEIYPGEMLPEAGSTVEDAVEEILAKEDATAEEKMDAILAYADGEMLAEEMEKNPELAEKLEEVADAAVSVSATVEAQVESLLVDGAAKIENAEINGLLNGDKKAELVVGKPANEVVVDSQYAQAKQLQLDIKLVDNSDKELKIYSPVKITIPAPKGFELNANLKLLHFAADGSYDEVVITITGESITFTVDSFSTFVFVGDEAEEEDDDDDEDEDEEEEVKKPAASTGSTSGSATSPKTFFEEGSFINSILWPETDSKQDVQSEQPAAVENAAADVENTDAEDTDPAAGALVQTAEKSGGNMFAIIVVAALAVIAASGVILFRRKNDEI